MPVSDGIHPDISDAYTIFRERMLRYPSVTGKGKVKLSTYIIVDKRLLHLQIANAWKRYLSVSFIIADDTLACDSFRKSLLLEDMAYDVELKVKDLTQMYKQADGWEPDGNTLIITGDLKNVERLLTCPFVVDAIYISFIRSWAGSYLVQNYALLDQEDCRILDALDTLPVPLIFQRSPADPAYSWSSIKGSAGYV